MGFGVSDADLHATIEELRELPDEEFDELFEEETDGTGLSRQALPEVRHDVLHESRLCALASMGSAKTRSA